MSDDDVQSIILKHIPPRKDPPERLTYKYSVISSSPVLGRKAGRICERLGNRLIKSRSHLLEALPAASTEVAYCSVVPVRPPTTIDYLHLLTAVLSSRQLTASRSYRIIQRLIRHSKQPPATMSLYL